MELHPEELRLARLYSRYRPFEGLTPAQLGRIMDRARGLQRWVSAHRRLHCGMGALVIAGLLVVDGLVLIGLPTWWLGSGPGADPGAVVLAGLGVGALHGWVLYALTIYSLHEGAAHRGIFPPTGRITRVLDGLAGNLCRLGAADPVEYRRCHGLHHARFGSPDDAEFVSFVLPRRYWRTLLPFAMLVNVSDFVAHRPLAYTRSRALSDAVTLVYHGAYGYVAFRRFGAAFTLLALALVAPHVAFQLDRLRQFSEHNLMPIENTDGARSFGPGFWGLLIGGGPWGQPCHWIHHLAPGLPWYQQIALHRFVVRILTPQQRRQYLLQPVIGYPRLLWHLWTRPRAFRRMAASVGDRNQPTSSP